MLQEDLIFSFGAYTFDLIKIKSKNIRVLVSASD